MNIPKGFEILFLFFIPGIPFLLLYWLEVGLLTKFKKSEMAERKTTANTVLGVVFLFNICL
jgi:hypothetical protein